MAAFPLSLTQIGLHFLDRLAYELRAPGSPIAFAGEAQLGDVVPVFAPLSWPPDLHRRIPAPVRLTDSHTVALSLDWLLLQSPPWKTTPLLYEKAVEMADLIRQRWHGGSVLVVAIPPAPSGCESAPCTDQLGLAVRVTRAFDPVNCSEALYFSMLTGCAGAKLSRAAERRIAALLEARAALEAQLEGLREAA